MKWEDFLPAAPIEHLWLEKIRQSFTPEVLVPPEMTVRSPNLHRVEAGLTDYLLDYNQEAAVKADLDIAPEGQALINDFRLNIINGVAGSGKTLILLFRLRLLYHLYPDKISWYSPTTGRSATICKAFRPAGRKPAGKY